MTDIDHVLYSTTNESETDENTVPPGTLLLSTAVGKLNGILLNYKIKNRTDEILGEKQCSFRSERGF